MTRPVPFPEHPKDPVTQRRLANVERRSLTRPQIDQQEVQNAGFLRTAVYLAGALTVAPAGGEYDVPFDVLIEDYLEMWDPTSPGPLTVRTDDVYLVTATVGWWPSTTATLVRGAFLYGGSQFLDGSSIVPVADPYLTFQSLSATARLAPGDVIRVGVSSLDPPGSSVDVRDTLTKLEVVRLSTE